MNNKDNKTSGFEDEIRNKMDELASSVDCFDKISKRAFPENSSSSFDSEFTVSSVENVTGKKKISRFMPAAALAAAAAVCLVALPRSESFMDFYSSLGDSENASFRDLISEIREETASGSYTYFDCSLKDYVRYDRLITPLYDCPFEASDKDDINVRIYVKLHGNTPTNQIYAVEYEGGYEDNNIIAAADSHAKFTNEELEGFSTSGMYTVTNGLGGALEASNGYFTLNGYETGAVAGVSYNCIYKHEGDIYDLSNELIYCSTDAAQTGSSYFYDVRSVSKGTDQSTVSDEIFSGFWDNSVYYNGSSAMPDKSYSEFTHAEMFGNINDKFSVNFVYPYISASEDYRYSDMSGNTLSITVTGEDNAEASGKLLPPLEPSLRDTFRIYVPKTASNLMVYSADGRLEYGYTSEKFASEQTTISAYGANGNYYAYQQAKALEEKSNEVIAQQEFEAQQQALEAEEQRLSEEIAQLRIIIRGLENTIALEEQQLANGGDPETMNQIQQQIEMHEAEIAMHEARLAELQNSPEDITQ